MELMSDATPHYVCKHILSQHLSLDYAESVYTTLTGCSVVIAHGRAYEEANISKDSLYEPTHMKTKHLEFEIGLGGRCNWPSICPVVRFGMRADGTFGLYYKRASL
jgi:hypothetical protein